MVYKSFFGFAMVLKSLTQNSFVIHWEYCGDVVNVSVQPNYPKIIFTTVRSIYALYPTPFLILLEPGQILSRSLDH
jgi:hypothetical protein